MSYSLFILSGLVVPEFRGNETVPEVVTTSGYALLHFFSDAAYNLTGFNIAYSYVQTLSVHSLPFCPSVRLIQKHTHRLQIPKDGLFIMGKHK